MVDFVPGDDFQNIRSARDFFLRQWGVLAITRPHESDYTVGTTAVLLGSTIEQRIGWNLSNTGTVNVAVAFSQGVTITTGLLLEPGGFLTANWFYDLELVTRNIYAIGAGSGATLHLIENLIAGA
jgi:hypothetical protein